MVKPETLVRGWSKMSSLLLIPWFFLLNFVLDVRDREAWVLIPIIIL